MLRTHGLLSHREASLVGEDVCRALAAVHRAGYVHRDVKAQNVMRNADGENILMDFGTGQDVSGARRPRDNPTWPKVGIFAQRARVRPYRLGLSIVRILRCDGHSLFVEGLDAVNRTPVLDIKPVMTEFLPREPVRQPDWSRELMIDYWNPSQEDADAEG